MAQSAGEGGGHKVNFGKPRSFGTVLKKNLKETLFPDDPFRPLRNQPRATKIKKTIQYFAPIFEWFPNYSIHLFKFDLLSGITILSLAIPQGISYAKLANIPPIIGLYSSFVPPLIYAVFGSSKHLAVGTVAACSLLIAETIGKKVSPKDDPSLYLSLVFTATLITGLLQTALGILRLGILVEFLSHSTIAGFMGGTAILICLQQLKGFLGMQHFTTHTDVVDVIRTVFQNRHEWRWESALVGVIFLAFLQYTRYVKNKKPNLFWVSAVAPMVTVIVGCLFAYFAHAEKHGIPIVGDLKRGLNPLSIARINLDPKYISAPLQAGIVTAMIALAEGIAIGRSFALLQNEQIDGNKEMMAFGLMNIVGSLTSCYLTTGPFSKTAVNFNAGCKTAMSNIVMAICMMFVLLFLAPVFSYTPLVALSTIIMSAMFGLIDFEKYYHLYKTDKFDFLICMVAFFGVPFISMDVGIIMSVGLACIRALLYVARPGTYRLGHVQDSALYRDIEQYPGVTTLPGIIILQLGSPIFFANCSYMRERVLRWIRDEQESGDEVEHLILDLGGVSAIDITGIETLSDLRINLNAKGIKMILVNPKIRVMEKMVLGKIIDKIGKEWVFLSVEDAVEACQFTLRTSSSKPMMNGGDGVANGDEFRQNA